MPIEIATAQAAGGLRRALQIWCTPPPRCRCFSSMGIILEAYAFNVGILAVNPLRA